MLDGGLERLIHILRYPSQSVSNTMGYNRSSVSMAEMQANWKWSLAFQCVVNIGVRGSEAIRTRVVEAGMVPIIIKVLDNYLLTSERIHTQQRKAMNARENLSHEQGYRAIYPQAEPSVPTATPMDTDTNGSNTDHTYWSADRGRQGSRDAFALQQRGPGDASTSASASECAEDTEMYNEEENVCPGASVVLTSKPDMQETETPRAPRTSTLEPCADESAEVTRTPRAEQTVMQEAMQQDESNVWQPSAPVVMSEPMSPVQAPLYREEEVLLSLQLLAYLSKYPHVRYFFHNANVREDMIFCPEWPEEGLPNRSWQPTDPPRLNVFCVAERFTHRPTRSSIAPGVLCSLYPRLAPDIQYWAGVVMRNACRKDESRGGIRQCANMLCGKWETYPREFAKCRRCRKAKYCSKQCQSKGWQMGHRFWCSARSDEDKSRASESHATVHPTVLPDAPRNVDTPATIPAMPDTVREVSEDYSHPLGPRNVPSTLRENQLPALRGVSAASIESNDLHEMSDDATMHPGETPSVDSPAGPSNAEQALPPPIIAGGLPMHETDPATATLRAQEAQNIQDHGGPLDFVTASWAPQPVVSDHATESPLPNHASTESPFDLGITLPSPNSIPTLHSNDDNASSHASYTAPWRHMAISAAFLGAHRTPRAMTMFDANPTSPSMDESEASQQDTQMLPPTSHLLASLHHQMPPSHGRNTDTRDMSDAQ